MLSDSMFTQIVGTSVLSCFNGNSNSVRHRSFSQIVLKNILSNDNSNAVRQQVSQTVWMFCHGLMA